MAATKKKEAVELLQTPIPVERHDLSGVRWYGATDSYWDKHFPDTPKIYKRSSTTIENVIDKGIGFYKWLGGSPSYDAAMEYGNYRALIGTMVHDYCERVLRGIEVDFLKEPKWLNQETGELITVTREVQKYMMSFMQFCEDISQNGNFITEALEICMYDLATDNEGNQLHSWAGTADWVVKIVNKKGVEERWMIDFKTGKSYDAHQLQLTSYKVLFESIFPDHQLDGLACLYLKSGWRKKPNYTFKKYKPDISTWNKVVAVSDWANNYPVPSFPPELPTTFSLKEAQEQQEESA